MASNKILRVNEDIRRVLSALLRDMKDPRLQQGMLILPSSIIAGDLNFDVNDSTVALHMTLNSWKPKQKKHPLRDFIKKLKANVFLRKLFGKEIK